MRRPRLCRSAALLAPLLLVSAGFAGCASPWKRTFEPATEAVYPPTERVVIRSVPWERVNTALREIERARADSDISPVEWGRDRQLAEQARLASALQLSEDPESLAVLGRSVFKSVGDVRVLDGSLSSFARSIGADYAVWSTTYLGKTQSVETETISRHGYTYGRHRRRDGRIDYDYLPYYETIYVPVVVERDQHAWIVYYVRIEE